VQSEPNLNPVVLSIEAKLRRAGKGKRLIIANGSKRNFAGCHCPGRASCQGGINQGAQRSSSGIARTSPDAKEARASSSGASRARRDCRWPEERRQQVSNVPAISVSDAMASPLLFGPFFRGPSWDMWRAVLKAAAAEPMSLPLPHHHELRM
jgi:hypothetical protein